jgi:autotransporter-associated beta strand protein
MSSRMNRSSVVLMLATLAVSGIARAENVTWLGAGATTNWTNTSNWVGLNRPDNNGEDTVFMQDQLQHTTNHVNQDWWIDALYFDVVDGRETSWTINQSNVAVLSVDYAIGNRTSKTQTINVPIRLTGGVNLCNDDVGTPVRGLINVGAIDLNHNRLWTWASSTGINLTGPISGVGDVALHGTGPVSLWGSNSWEGGLIIASGTAIIGAGVNLGSINNRVVFDQTDGTSVPTLRRTTSGTLAIPLRFESGEGRIDTPAGVTVTVTSRLTGFSASTFAKTGPGTLVLTAPALNDNTTIVRGGTLQLGVNRAVSDQAMQVLSGSNLVLNANVTQTVNSLDGFGSIQLGNDSLLSIGAIFYSSVSNGIGTFGGVISGTNASLLKRGGGTFTLAGASTYGGITEVQRGVLVANNTTGSATGISTVSVKSGARLTGDGAISGPVTIEGGATISPSKSPTPDAGIGSLGTGNLTLLNAASTRIEYTAAEMDRINVNGDATIRGTLDLIQFGSGTSIPSLGTVRTILTTTGDVVGVFSGVNGLSLSDKDSWAVTYTIKDILATIATPGDINLDSAVNFADLLLLAQNYSGTGIKTWSQGDMSGDGTVSFPDLLLLAQNYGSATGTLGGGSDFAAEWALAQSMVPEPTAVLAISAVVPALLRRRRGWAGRRRDV